MRIVTVTEPTIHSSCKILKQRCYICYNSIGTCSSSSSSSSISSSSISITNINGSISSSSINGSYSVVVYVVFNTVVVVLE